MATRPVYCSSEFAPYVQIVNVNFTFYSGFSATQKQKSFLSLHENFRKDSQYHNILEVSSKSDVDLGVSLSAFNLKITTKNRSFSVENAFQSSKVFELGGPYIDLLDVSSKEAKKDERLKNSGKLIAFNYFKKLYPLEPKDFFYNWLYINALYLNLKFSKQILEYDAFTDIEFNPQKSINCQAKAAAIFVGLSRAKKLEEALLSHDNFLNIVYNKQLSKTNYEQISFNLSEENL